MSKEIILVLIIFFNVVFPKGGIILGGIPVSWGYLMVGMISVHALIMYATEFTKKTLPQFLNIQLTLVACFQAVALLCIFFNGYESFGFVVSLFVGVFIFPVMIILFGNYFNGIEVQKIEIYFVYSVRCIVVIGLANFTLKLLNMPTIELYGLSAAIGDSLTIEDRFNDRGGIFKLVSTFGNGNIYAICMLIILAPYQEAEKNNLFLMLCKISIMLTLSRTAWFGLVLYEIAKLTLNSDSLWKKLLKLIFYITGIYVLILLLLGVMDLDLNFLFDSELGGRGEQLKIFDSYQFISDVAFTGVEEIVYLSLLKQFGLFALVLYLLIMFLPIYVGIRKYFKGVKSILPFLISATLYPIIGLSDAALQFVPVMLFYWAIVFFIFKLK